jgi:hypothetical protein
VVEAALHLVEEALLLFRKWHLRLPFSVGPITRGIDAMTAILGAFALARLGAWLGVRG